VPDSVLLKPAVPTELKRPFRELPSLAARSVSSRATNIGAGDIEYFQWSMADDRSLSQKVADLAAEVRTLKADRHAPAQVVQANVPLPKNDGWVKRNVHRIALASLCVAFLGLALGTGFPMRFFNLTVGEQIDLKLAQPIGDIHKLQIDVGKVSAKLDTFIELERDRLNKLSALKPKQLSEQLPEVADALTTARALGIKASASEENSLRENFLSVGEHSPDFWPAAAALINYRSREPNKELPDCLDQPLRMDQIGRMENGIFTHGPIKFSDCRIELDSPKAAHKLGLGLRFANLELIRCFVVYHGGAILLLPQDAVGKLVS